MAAKAVDSTLNAHYQSTSLSQLSAVEHMMTGIAHVREWCPLRDNIAVGVYAQSGAGKSTELNVAFQDAVVYKTLPTVTRPYYSIVREQARDVFDRTVYDYKKANAAYGAMYPEMLDKYAEKEGLLAVEKVTGWRGLLAEVDIPSYIQGSTTPYWSFMDAVKNRFLEWTRRGDKLPMSGGVFDEMNEIFRLVFEEMKPHFPPKKVTNTIFDDVPAMNAHEAWMRDFIHSFRSNGLLIGCVFQEAPLSFDEDKSSRFYGKIKYKIGPRTPFGRERSLVTEAMDVMLRITLEQSTVVTAPMAALPAGSPPMPGQPGHPPSPGAAPTAPVPSAQMGPSAASLNPMRVQGIENAPETLTDAEWPLPLRPIQGYGARWYWTAARDDIEAKFRDINVAHREPLGLRRLLKKATYL